MARTLLIQALRASISQLGNYAGFPLSIGELAFEPSKGDLWAGGGSDNVRASLRPHFEYVQNLAAQAHNQRSYQPALPALSFNCPVDGTYEFIWSAVIRANSLNHKINTRALIDGSEIGSFYKRDVDSCDMNIFQRYIVDLPAGQSGTFGVEFYSNRGTPSLSDLHLSVERKF